MFVNHGWAPGRVAELTSREKVIATLFAIKEIKDRPKKEGI